jgi:hypothetical protein
MNIIVSVIGWVLVAEGLLGIIRPHLMLEQFLGWSPDLRLYATVGSRIVIGLLLFFAAPSCRLPRVIRIIGIIMFVAGFVYIFIGASRLGSIVEWISGKPSLVIQLLYLLAIILGGFLVYSGGWARKAR